MMPSDLDTDLDRLITVRDCRGFMGDFTVEGVIQIELRPNLTYGSNMIVSHECATFGGVDVARAKIRETIKTKIRKLVFDDLLASTLPQPSTYGYTVIPVKEVQDGKIFVAPGGYMFVNIMLQDRLR